MSCADNTQMQNPSKATLLFRQSKTTEVISRQIIRDLIKMVTTESLHDSPSRRIKLELTSAMSELLHTRVSTPLPVADVATTSVRMHSISPFLSHRSSKSIRRDPPALFVKTRSRSRRRRHDDLRRSLKQESKIQMNLPKDTLRPPQRLHFENSFHIKTVITEQRRACLHSPLRRRHHGRFLLMTTQRKVPLPLLPLLDCISDEILEMESGKESPFLSLRFHVKDTLAKQSLCSRASDPTISPK